MSQKRLTTGIEVPPGIYRCNACAKQIDCKDEECKLPQCSACGGFSWRTTSLYRNKASTQ